MQRYKSVTDFTFAAKKDRQKTASDGKSDAVCDRFGCGTSRCAENGSYDTVTVTGKTKVSPTSSLQMRYFEAMSPQPSHASSMPYHGSMQT